MWYLSLSNLSPYQGVGTAAVEETKCGFVRVSPLGGLQFHSYCSLQEKKKFSLLFLSAAEEEGEKQMDSSSSWICIMVWLYRAIVF